MTSVRSISASWWRRASRPATPRPLRVRSMRPSRATLTRSSRRMRFTAAVTAGGVTPSSLARRAPIGCWPSSTSSQMALRECSWETLVLLRCKVSPLGGLAGANTGRERFYLRTNVFKSALVHIRIRAVRIVHVPILNFAQIGDGVAEGAFARIAAHVNDQVGGGPSVIEDGLRVETFDRIAVALEGLQRECLHHAKGAQTCAGGFEEVGNIAQSDRIGHRAAAGVADADKQDAEPRGR